MNMCNRMPPANKVVLVGGTWWTKYKGAWPRPGSEFSDMLRRHGVKLTSHRGFGAFSGGVDGIPSMFTGGLQRASWSAGGEALLWHALATCGVHGHQTSKPSVIAHSHAGQVVAYAALFGMCFDVVITMATPYRKDMESNYKILRSRCSKWVHLYSDHKDFTQVAGSLFDGWLGVERTMPHAHFNQEYKGVSHGEFVTEQYWEKHKHYLLLPGARE